MSNYHIKIDVVLSYVAVMLYCICLLFVYGKRKDISIIIIINHIIATYVLVLMKLVIRYVSSTSNFILNVGILSD